MNKKNIFSFLIFMFVMNFNHALAYEVNVLCDDEVEVCIENLKDSLDKIKCDISEAYTTCDLTTKIRGMEYKICTSMFVKNCKNASADPKGNELLSCEKGYVALNLSYYKESLSAFLNPSANALVCRK